MHMAPERLGRSQKIAMLTLLGYMEQVKKWLPRRFLVLLAPILLSIAAIAISAIVRARNDALDKAHLEASNISAALGEDVEGSLNTLACASIFVVQRVEKEGNAANLPELKEQIAKNSPALTAISIIGADGKLRASSSGEALGSPDYSDLDFFIAQRDGKGTSFQIGIPITLSHRTVIPVTRRLEANGKFAGAVLFSIDPEIGAPTLRQVNAGKTGSIKIVGVDGTVFAGYTLPRGYDASLIGTSAATAEAFAHRAAKSGSFVGASPSDGIERVYSWRRIPGFPLVAIVGLGKAEALAGANRAALLIASLAALSAALLLVKALLLKREFARRAKQALALDNHRRELREMNALLIAAKRQAEEANKSKSIFLANIGHELRTPLNAILGFAEIIRDQVFGNDPERYSRYAADIHSAGTYLLSVMRNLLDVSKIEAAKFELQEARIEFGELVRECLRLVEGQAKARGLTLSASPIGGVFLQADETALKQILINLLSNAIKFTPEGGSVSLSSRIESDGGLTVTITDSGAGMSAEDIRQALEPFRQVRNKSSTHPEGTGLGLPLASQLAGLHGGSLTIDSAPGRGTAVSVRFPAWRVSASEDRGSYPSAPLQSNP